MTTFRKVHLFAISNSLFLASLLPCCQLVSAQVPAITLSKPSTPDKTPNADGFIQRWVILEPIGAPGLTQSAVQAEVRKEYFPGQFTKIPHDGDRVSVDGSELT
jgi:hypothetical protein